MAVDTFLRRSNGLDRPLYFDRQLLQAEDLSLEQGFGDQRLALLARNCLGWGVAAGLILRLENDPHGGSAGLSVSPGYALTPMGEEVYLPAAVSFAGIEALIRTLCHDLPDCRNVDASGAPEAGAEMLVAWIIARVAEQDGGLRTAFPDGCGHPGNTTRPSRRCGGARIEIACAIAPPNSDPLPDPHGLREIICNPWGPELAPDVAPDLDYVVLGRVEIRPEGLFVAAEDRRRIARLDQVGRGVCRCHDTDLRFVTHIQRDQRDADHAIDKLAGIDEGGAFWIETLDEAIARIEGGGVTYVTLPPDGGAGSVVRVHRRKTKKYLRTDEDATRPNNLLSLPEIGMR